MPKAGDLIRATPNTATETSASGVWSANQAYDFVRQNSWPNASAIGQSLIFNDNDDQYLSRTPASEGNRKTWTWSGWVKIGNQGISRYLFTVGTSTQNNTQIFLWSGDRLLIENKENNSFNVRNYTLPLLRDSSAWYHFVVVFDTTNAIEDNRCLVYINGEKLENNNIDPIPQDQNTQVNTTNIHIIGRVSYSNSNYFDGYLAEVNFIDGQALDPTNFGKTDPTYGHWVPKKYSGSYGANGFYLDFSDNTALGTDKSGNDNTWTANNFSASQATVVDTPTEYGTDRGQGGEVKGNYATLSPIASPTNLMTFSNGNLTVVASTSNFTKAACSVAPSYGKWYFESVVDTAFSSSNRLQMSIHINPPKISTANQNGLETGEVSFNYRTNNDEAVIAKDGSTVISNSNFVTQGDVIGCRLDIDNRTVEFLVNNVSYGLLVLEESDLYYISLIIRGSEGQTANFGQRPFSYPAPEGFKCLTARNLEQPTIENPKDYFNTVLYTGNESSDRAITGVGFQPDFIWNKERSSTSFHNLVDVIRGPNNRIYSNATEAEQTVPASFKSFDTDGFTIGNDGGTNESGQTYVAWNWKAGGAGVTNTDGSITSTVSASPESGFSIVSYTGVLTTGSGTQIGHGLTATPDFIIIKNRSRASTNWVAWSSAYGTNQTLRLQTNDPLVAADSGRFVGVSATTFSVGYYFDAGYLDDNFIAYCFRSVEGFSKFGSYTGNGSTDGPFVYTGFRPAFVLIKRTSGVNSWNIMDNRREGYNPQNDLLFPDNSNNESNVTDQDMLSNGFKLRTTGSGRNGSGETYIYMAIAENPFKFTNAR